MKKTTTILILSFTFFLFKTVSAQESVKQNEELNLTGEFHIGLTDFASLEDGVSKLRIMPRFGYMISNTDMLYIDFTYVYEQGDISKGFNIESSVNYRKYLKEGTFRPFIQAGIGAGYKESTNIYLDLDSYQQYIKAVTGVGISYRYKRWTFEAGMQFNYNEYGTGRFQLKPMVGVSFSF